MNLKNTNARIAGLLYLVIALAGGFNFGYVHSAVFDPMSALKTAENVARNPLLFDLSALSGIVAFACDVVIAVMFYYLFRGINAGLSLVAAGFRLVQTAILGANTLQLTKISAIVSGSGVLADPRAATDIWLSVKNHELGFDVAMIFFGIHCVLLGMLVFKSPQFAKWLAYAIVAAGVVYVVDAVCSLMHLRVAETTGLVVAVTAIFAELSLVFWLLLKKFEKTQP
jgi:hypothetical protein